jgi:hypothetical protein
MSRSRSGTGGPPNVPTRGGMNEPVMLSPSADGRRISVFCFLEMRIRDGGGGAAETAVAIKNQTKTEMGRSYFSMT